jgi:hypothetical protein
MSIDQAVGILRTLEAGSPTTQFHLPAAVPKGVALDTAAVAPDRCLACDIAAIVRGGERPFHPITVDRNELIYGRGIPLKVLLTVYRWGRPYKRHRKDDPPDAYRLQQAVAPLRLAELTRDALGGHATELQPLDPAVRAARRAVDALDGMGFIQTVEDHGRGRANFYVPHRIEPPISVPPGLWQRDWISHLSGVALLTLLQLWAYQQEPVVTGWVLTSLSTPMRKLVKRARVVVERDQLRSHNPSQGAINRGLAELMQMGLAVELRGRSGTFIGLTDAGLTRPFRGG